MPKQALEQIVMDELGELLNLRYTPGSGSVRGDADVVPKATDSSCPVQVGFECKDRGVASHSVPAAEWKKAKMQISRQGLDPVFVTRNKDREVLVHLEMSAFRNLLEMILEKV